MPLLSVIIPVHNVDGYLRECLDSILDQIFQDMEIICIDDGSTDNSPVILKEYARKNPKIVVINQENKRQAAARNVGLKISKGKYVSFVDSDDWINRNMYESLMSLMKDDIDLVVFDANIFGEPDRLANKYFRMKFSGKLSIDGNIIFNCPVSPWNKIYRKDIIDKYKISFPEEWLYEDNSFHWKYMMHSKSAYFLNEKFYNYRIRKDSTMSKTKSKVLKLADHLWVCLEIFEYMRKYNLLEKYQISFLDFFKHCLGLVVYANTNGLFEFCKIANEVWSKINIPTNCPIIRALNRKDYDYIIKWVGYKSIEKIFSIKRRFGAKRITVCGLQFGVKFIR